MAGIIILIPITSGTGTQEDPATPNLSPYTQYAQWGRYGSEPGEFDDITDIATGPDGTIYVSDHGNNRIQTFSENGTFLQSWGEYNPDNRLLINPGGLVTDTGGNLYMIELLFNRIFMWNRTSTQTKTYEIPETLVGRHWGEKTIALDTSKNIYIADPGNRTIWKTSPNGEFVQSWKFPYLGGEEHPPKQILIDANNTVYVCDSWSEYIYTYSDKGVLTGSFPIEKTNTSNKYWATDIALGHDGYLYCYILGDNTLRILDAHGTLIRRENLPQTGRKFSHLALNSADDLILADQNSITCFQKNDSLFQKTPTGVRNETRNQSFKQNNTYTTWNVPVEVIRSPFIHYTMSAIQDSDGSLFATAAENDGVVKTDPLGHAIFSINHGISKSDLQKPEYCMCAGYNRTRSTQNPIYEPIGIVQDTSGNLYISTNTGIDTFSRDGENLSTIEQNCTTYCNLSTPAGLALGPDGVLYVADSSRNCIVAFSQDGKRINEWGHKGVLNGEFKEPWGVAVDQKGTVYITDTMNHRVQTFSSNGTWTGTWGSKGSDIGRFSRPTGILADSGGLIYISDSGNFRIQVFTGNGTPLGEIIPYSADLGGRPGVYGLFKNSDGDIYAVSNSNGSILKMLWSLKEQGTANGSIITIEPPNPVIQGIVIWIEEISWIAHQLYEGNYDQIQSAVIGEREA